MSSNNSRTLITSEMYANIYNGSATMNGNFSVTEQVFGHYIDYNSNTTNTYRMVPEPPSYLVNFITTLYVLIFIIGLFGNIIVVIVVGCSRNMRTTINIYLVNLCIADLLVLIVCMPPVLVELHVKEVWYFGEAMCKFVPFLEVVVASASVFTIIAISVERFRVVFQPFSATNDNIIKAFKSIICIWLSGVLLSIPILFIVIYKNTKLVDGTPVKVCRTSIKHDRQRFYFVLVGCLNYVIPCIVIIILYSLVCRKLVLKRNIPLVEYDGNYREKRRLRKQMTRILWSIVCVFFLCHLPFRVVCIWWMFEDIRNIKSLGLENNLLILYFARFFLYINHALNPILYNFFSKKFRFSFMYLMFPSQRCRSSVRTNENRMPNFSDSNRHEAPMHKNINSKNVRHVKVEDDYNSSSSSGRERINDFSSVYIKQMAGKNTDDVQLVDLGQCRFKFSSSKERMPLIEEASVDENKSDLTAFKLVIDSDGYVVAVRLHNTNFYRK